MSGMIRSTTAAEKERPSGEGERLLGVAHRDRLDVPVVQRVGHRAGEGGVVVHHEDVVARGARRMGEAFGIGGVRRDFVFT